MAKAKRLSYNEKAYDGNLKLAYYLTPAGKKIGYIDHNKVFSYVFNAPYGTNRKTGKHTIVISFPVAQTCVNCECKNKKKCYGLTGTFCFPDNQIRLSENLSFYFAHTAGEIASEIIKAIDSHQNVAFVRLFGVGDCPGEKFIDAVNIAANARPDIPFYGYTKKYKMYNHFVSTHGDSYDIAFPDNVTWIFSHWLNDDGTYFEMDNPYNFPTSEFIPAGKEYLIKTVTHVCPCSNPEKEGHCETCENPCYKLRPGESMALLEHSTTATKARDKFIKAARENHTATFDDVLNF